MTTLGEFGEWVQEKLFFLDYAPVIFTSAKSGFHLDRLLAGKVIFKQENVEVPKSWSLLATKVVVSKYFYGEQNTPERETSVRQLIHRVCRTIADWGVEDGYFSKADGEVFYDELTWLCLNQYGAFNSPVWFNVGLYHQYGVGNDSGRGNWFYNPQDRPGRARRDPVRISRSAAPASSSPSRTTWRASCAWPTARRCSSSSAPAPAPTSRPSARARRSSAAADGPAARCRFLKVYDQVANVVKSGGKTRRAAKMNTLRDWHGDIEEFIDAKQKEEKKAWALIEQGYDGSYNGDAYGSVMYQNENLSVRVSDEFMQAALDGQGMVDARRHHRQAAGEEGRRAAAATRSPKAPGSAAIPGLQYDGAIQKWHTCKGTEPIHSTNPCSRIRVPQQHRLQPGVAEPDEVQARGRHVRRRALQGRRAHLHHRPGNPRGQRQLSHQGDRRELAHLPHARPRLRQPRLADHELRPALRLATKAAPWPARSPPS